MTTGTADYVKIGNAIARAAQDGDIVPVSKVLADIFSREDKTFDVDDFLDICTVRSYQVTRCYADDSHPDHRKVIRTGLTYDQAREHCRQEDTREEGVWFDAWSESD